MGLSKKLFVILLISFALRLVLSPLTQNNDVYTQAAWGEWMYEHGFKGTYSNTQWKVIEWPNHPPLITLWYGFSYQLHSVIMGILSSFGVFIASNRLGAGHTPRFFKFAAWYGSEKAPLSMFLSGIFVTTKFLPILADILLGGLIYYLA